MKRLSRRVIIRLLLVLLAVALIFTGAGLYFFHLAVIPGKKSFLGSHTPLKRTSMVYRNRQWYRQASKQHWLMQSASGHYRLDANYLPKTSSHKTAIILHG